MKRSAPVQTLGNVLMHGKYGPYVVYSEHCGWYTLYSIINRDTGFAILHHKVAA